ncbi:tRNA-dihydrouridine synthase [Vairimorpha necatrix]|uniref:tRNA-dihydrouridine synthase n=1 Tax=Vairimorpha necatrix TaxID=6039 RepID=A0AAX4JAM9_9MICR
MNFLENFVKPYKILAPMVGNSELSWRKLSRRYGADFCFTEMINCDTFLRSNQNPLSNKFYTTNQEDRPLIIQICGNDISKMLKVSLLVQDFCDAIDINLGCPQEIARRGHYGSFLQDDWELVEKIIKELSTHLKVPVTCKIRIFESIEKSVEYAKMIEKAGCKMLTVHGRQRHQRGVNTGLASWAHIKAIKEALNIPVISNGNIIYNSDIQRCVEYTKCDGVMVAETHLYNPLIFTNIKDKTSVEIYREYLEIYREEYNEYDLGNIKSHTYKILQVFLKEYKEFREEINLCKKLEDYEKISEKIEKFIKEKQVDEKYLRMEPNIRQK